MAEYLKKKRLYELTTRLQPHKKFPLMKNCDYRFSHGAEWLCFSGVGDDYHYYKVSSQKCGEWIMITESGKVNGKDTVIRSDVYAELVNGEYQYHSVQECKEKIE